MHDVVAEKRHQVCTLVPLRIIRDDDGDYVMFWAVPLLHCGECAGCTIDTYVLPVRDELPTGLRRHM